jgi:uncharacterized protein DUF6438
MRQTVQTRRLALVASLATLLLLTCARVVRSQESHPAAQIPRDSLITLERTICYGMCPSYKLRISADGAVVFEGRRFVKTVGTAQSAISQDQLRELLAKFEKLDYFNLRNRYEGPRDGCEGLVTDHPSALTSITTNGKTKSVRHYYGCRGVEVLDELTKLEQAIDDAVNSEQWIR